MPFALLPRGLCSEVYVPPSSLEASSGCESYLFTASPDGSRVNRLLHKKIQIRFMTLRKTSILLSLLAWLLLAVSCDHSVVTGSKLTLSNYDQITPGMTKAQVERILGPPTTVETKDMMIFKKTTYRYEDGKKFAMFTFKKDELDSKEANLQREP
jgi:hypothetical protein